MLQTTVAPVIVSGDKKNLHVFSRVQVICDLYNIFHYTSLEPAYCMQIMVSYPYWEVA